MLLTKNITVLKDFGEGVYQGLLTKATIIVKEQLAHDYILACDGTNIDVEVNNNIKSELAIKFVIEVDANIMHHIVYHSDNGKMSPIEYELNYLARQLNLYGNNTMLDIINNSIYSKVNIEIRRSACGKYLNKSFRVISDEVNELADILV